MDISRNISNLTIFLFLIFVISNCSGKSNDENNSSTEIKLPDQQVEEVSILPKMIDLGSEHCIPCKKMAPILDSLKLEFQGKAEIVFIDIKKDRQAAVDYGIRLIPTQIFFDTAGNEVSRHIGFFSADSITARFKEIGVQ